MTPEILDKVAKTWIDGSDQASDNDLVEKIAESHQMMDVHVRSMLGRSKELLRKKKDVVGTSTNNGCWFVKSLSTAAVYAGK